MSFEIYTKRVEGLGRYERQFYYMVETSGVDAYGKHLLVPSLAGIREINTGLELDIPKIEGEDLLTFINASRIFPRKAADIQNLLSNLGEAIDFIHSNGYIHNDLESRNIRRSKQGEFFLLDFGSVKYFQDHTSDEYMLRVLNERSRVASFAFEITYYLDDDSYNQTVWEKLKGYTDSISELKSRMNRGEDIKDAFKELSDISTLAEEINLLYSS